MTYGMAVEVPMTLAQYEELHAQVLRAQEQAPADGLVVHFARTTPRGVEIVEVWTSKQACDRFGREVLGPVMARASAGAPDPGGPPPAPDEFEVHGLWLGGSRG